MTSLNEVMIHMSDAMLREIHKANSSSFETISLRLVSPPTYWLDLSLSVREGRKKLGVEISCDRCILLTEFL